MTLFQNFDILIFCSILQISYLAAFSCEISWILEAHGNLPTTAYLLCSGYFTLFVASTILIHGLATVLFSCYKLCVILTQLLNFLLGFVMGTIQLVYYDWMLSNTRTLSSYDNYHSILGNLLISESYATN